MRLPNTLGGFEECFMLGPLPIAWNLLGRNLGKKKNLKHAFPKWAQEVASSSKRGGGGGER